MSSIATTRITNVATSKPPDDMKTTRATGRGTSLATTTFWLVQCGIYYNR